MRAGHARWSRGLLGARAQGHVTGPAPRAAPRGCLARPGSSLAARQYQPAVLLAHPGSKSSQYKVCCKSV
eukprot:3645326-Rhodomonas_salina.1